MSDTHQKQVKIAAYWRGYQDAIKQADAAIRSRGDDPTIRLCRQAILALVKVPYEPRHVMPEPDWSKVASTIPKSSEQERT